MGVAAQNEEQEICEENIEMTGEWRQGSEGRDKVYNSGSGNIKNLIKV